MNFRLSLGTGGKGQGSSGGGRDELVKRAKEERAAREKQRELRSYAIKIQAFMRRKSGRISVLSSLRADFDRKVSDLQKLLSWLETSQTNASGPIAAPVDHTIRLIRSLLFFWSPTKEEDRKRLDLLCNTLLDRSLRFPQDVTKNFADAAWAKWPEHRYWYTKLLSMLVSSLEVNNYRTCPCPDPLTTIKLLTDPDSLPGPLRDITLSHLGPAIILATRRVLTPLASTYCDPHTSSLPSTQADVRPLLHCTHQLVNLQGLISLYIDNILTLPLITSNTGVDHAPFLASIITHLHPRPFPLDLPESPILSGPSSTWLLGNLSYLMATQPTNQCLPEDLLAQGLDILGSLLLRVPCGFVSDRGAITLEQQGSRIITKVIPQPVVNQIQLCLREDFIRTTVTRLIDGLDEAELKINRSEDVQDISKALHISSLQLTDASNREHRRQASRWFGARWASQIASHVGKVLSFQREGGGAEESKPSGADSPPPPPGYAEVPQVEPKRPPPAPGLIESLLRFLAIALWKDHSWSSTHQTATTPLLTGLLNTVAFSTRLVPRVWLYVLRQIKDDGAARRLTPLGSIPEGVHAGLGVLASSYGHMLMILDDAELHEDGYPLPLPHVVRLVKAAKLVLFNGCCAQAAGSMRLPTTKTAEGGVGEGEYGAYLVKNLAKMLRSLYDRWSRRPFCIPEVWVIPDTESRRNRREILEGTALGQCLLVLMPYCIPFSDRMRIFESWMRADREYHQPEGVRPNIVRIRRWMVLEDGLSLLDQLGERLRNRIVIVYVNEAGAEEPGIDMGGVFKDFWCDLSALAFDLNFGLWKQTASGALYPNPSSFMIHANHLRLFEFVGRVLGKAMYEGITITPVFAHFFLGFLRGSYNWLAMFNDLETLDPELYKNLMFLKTYDGDVADLSLSFTVVDDDLGKQQEVELVPGGASMPVTNANRFRYINLVAKHHLYDRMRMQSEAFVRGFHDVTNYRFLQMFNEPELQILISGSPAGIDVQDLKANTRYSGGYTLADRNVRRFWRVLESFTPADQAAFLRFVTSCPRPPPLGFAGLQPPFTIHRVGISRDDEKLPSASTCFNTIKLPTYSSEAVLREKLKYAIYSGAGFELS